MSRSHCFLWHGVLVFLPLLRLSLLSLLGQLIAIHQPLSLGAPEACSPWPCPSPSGPHSSYSFKRQEWEEQSQGLATQGCFSTQGRFLRMLLHHEPPPLHSTQTRPSSRIPHLREWLHHPSFVLMSVDILSFSNYHESCLVHLNICRPHPSSHMNPQPIIFVLLNAQPHL